MNFCTVFSTLGAMIRRAGFAQAIKAAHYGLIVLTAWAAAVVVVRLVGLDLHPKVSPLSTAGEPAAHADKSRRSASDAIILKRNLFGAADVDVAGDEAPAPAGAVDLRLRGIAASQGASFAVFENTSSGEQNVFGIGEKIFDGPKLVSVDTDGADVLFKGKKRRYEIEEDEAAATPIATVKNGSHLTGKKEEKAAKYVKAEKRGKDSKKNSAAEAAGVRKTGEGAYLVDRREVEHVVSNLNEVITQARAVPVLADGKSSGFRLINIRPGSIFEKIGLVDGDIVQRVNDTELNDPSKAMGLLTEIQSMGQIRVGFVRSGKPRSYTYTIR
ncbi:MAG TPA: type II secretion system protein GspC [Candidatus Limnocylindrales bacterium]|nr:type II secretion system protein GspC [Candidatus Limnocylindrales bacterium]